MHSFIIKIACRVALKYPGLWVFGLFLAIGFTSQFLFFGDSVASSQETALSSLTSYAQDFWRAYQEYTIVGLILVAAVFFVSLIFTSWIKVVLILQLQKILKLRRKEDLVPNIETARNLGDRRQGEGGLTPNDPLSQPLEPLWGVVKKSLGYVLQVSLVGLFTTAVTIFVLIGLSIPFFSFARGQEAGLFVWFAALVVFAFFTFAISCVGLFASFFVVLLKFNYKSSINLATELVVSKWQDIAGTVVLLAVVYCAAFLGGVYVLAMLERAFSLAGQELAQVLRNVILWGWLAVLNVFFHAAMMILFAQLVRPKMAEQAVSAMAASSAGIQG